MAVECGNLPAANSSLNGYYWICQTSGTLTGVAYNDAGGAKLDLPLNVGDWAIIHGDYYWKVDNTDEVTSVNGKTGAVTLSAYTAAVAGVTTGNGARVTLKVNAANAASATLAVNGGTALPIWNSLTNAAVAASVLAANAHYNFVCDGSHWVAMIGANTDTNTTYSTLTQALVDAGTETTGKLITAKIVADSIKKNKELAFDHDTLTGNVGFYLDANDDLHCVVNK